MTDQPHDVAADFATPEVIVEQQRDGSTIFRSPHLLGNYARNIGELLDQAADQVPNKIFLAEREGDHWAELTYGDARERVRRLGSALLKDKRLAGGRPLAILSDNSIDVALISMAAQYVGITVVPISSAYSTVSQTFEKLRAIVEATNPAVVYASDDRTYGRALRTVMPKDACILTTDRSEKDARWQSLTEFYSPSTDQRLVDEAATKVGRDTIAKIMFTSGSTGKPKGVLMTHGNILAHQQGISRSWLFLEHQPPVILDWLPWSHSFGGNHNFIMVLRHRGSMYIDDGRPLPGRIERTVANLRTVSPTITLSVPRAYGMLLPFLEGDPELARSFFRNCTMLFYAAADMPVTHWQRLEALAALYADKKPYFASSWGMSENIAAATIVHFPIKRAGSIGLPAPGTAIKLVPVDDKMELRIKGPGITQGYFGQPALTAAAFDEDGYYRSGDAGRLFDPAHPEAGFVYDGRISENFKLSSGRWVFVGELRTNAIAAGSPLVEDVAVAAPDRDEAALMVFLNLAACRKLVPDQASVGMAELAALPEIRSGIAKMLQTLAAGTEGAPQVKRAIILTEPPSVDAHEITDKGYINQRAVLERRADIVDRLYKPGCPEVITI